MVTINKDSIGGIQHINCMNFRQQMTLMTVIIAAQIGLCLFTCRAYTMDRYEPKIYALYHTSFQQVRLSCTVPQLVGPMVSSPYGVVWNVLLM